MPTVFSYGSNNTAQLRARLGNISLVTQPARLRDFARVFCLGTTRWSDAGGAACGVASIAPSAGAFVYGSAVDLTEAELAALSLFEGGYRQMSVSILMGGAADGAEHVRDATVYVAGAASACPPGQPWWTLPLTAPPSETYLVAIHGTLREHWPGQAASGIEIAGYEVPAPPRSGASGGAGAAPAVPIVTVQSRWRHPGPQSLGLKALCVEVSLLQEPADTWTVTRLTAGALPMVDGDIPRVIARLARVGILATAQLAVATANPAALNAALADAGEPGLAPATIRILRSLLL
jgi:hypothetical protein